MPKKQFLKEPKKKSKHTAPAPTTSDEFLEAGVDFEEAGEKWRGGDAVKAMRFFGRALDTYDDGLKKFPDSFDLAYNKARLQYEITQHPKLLPHLPGSLLELLATALESSRYALKLDPEDVDALFNTAQLLSELGHSKDSTEKASKLEEALWLFELCLQRQLRHFDLYNDAEKAGHPLKLKQAASLPPAQDVDMIDGESAQRPSLPQGTPEEQTNVYATLIEPTTKDTILDTIIAQLITLTQLIEETQPLSSSPKSLSLIRDYYKEAISKALERFEPYLGHPKTHDESSNLDPDLQLGERENEVKLAISNYECTLANFRFLTKDIDLAQYEAVVNSSYGFNMNNTPQALCDAAESLIDFHDAIAQLDVNFEPYTSQRWKVLSHALDFLSMAVKLPDCENKENIYAKRGDIELMRFQLGKKGIEYRVAVRDRETILKNAGKYYRGAMIFAQQAGSVGKFLEAEFRSFVVEAFLGDVSKLVNFATGGGAFRQLIEEAVIEGVMGEEQIYDLGLDKYLR